MNKKFIKSEREFIRSKINCIDCNTICENNRYVNVLVCKCGKSGFVSHIDYDAYGYFNDQIYFKFELDNCYINGFLYFKITNITSSITFPQYIEVNEGHSSVDIIDIINKTNLLFSKYKNNILFY
jgi:hypothetical protein